MQTVETLNEGLKRAFRLTIPAKDIDARIDAELKTIAPQVKMPGFRPGKVPANLVRKMHGPALQQQALDAAVQDSVQQLMAEQNLRPAMQPAVRLNEDFQPGQDAVIDIEVETLPQVPDAGIDGIALERLTVEVTPEMVDAQIATMAEGQKSFDPAPADHEARHGDAVLVDFEGKVDGVAFEGGTGTGMSVEIGSGRLIPGFEDQLIGARANEQRTLNVTFPDDYPVDYLKGRPATFDVTVNEVQTPKAAQADDDFAKSMGLESLEQLRGLLQGQVEQELNGLTRTYMKRQLLDQLAGQYDFEVPQTMVEAEFGQIWQQLEHEATHEADPEAARAEMEREREDYRRIAERRVRLGLLLSDVGQKNGVEISNQEMNQLIMQAAQQYRPEDRQRFVEYVRGEPMAAAQLRAPLYEDKVVDHIFAKAAITDRAVTREELEAAIESEEGGHVHGPDCNHDHDHDHATPAAEEVKPARKKAAPKKEEADAAPVETGAEDAPAAKQPAEAPAAPAKKPRKKKAEAAPEEGVASGSDEGAVAEAE